MFSRVFSRSLSACGNKYSARQFATESKYRYSMPPSPPTSKAQTAWKFIIISFGLTLITYLITLPRNTYDNIEPLPLPPSEEPASKQT